MQQSGRTYIAIDLKAFYASVECMERGLDPLTTNLVVADASRTEKTICLAVSPSLGSVSSVSVKGRGSPLESRAAMESINLLFPSPGSPCNSVTLPNGIYGYHSHFTSFGSISLALKLSRQVK